MRLHLGLMDYATTRNDDESIVAHFSDGLPLHYSKNEVIIQGFEEPEGVYLIKSGLVRAYSISQGGHENLLLIHEAGEFMPLPWALDGAHTTGLRYEAMTDTDVIRASKDKLRAAMGKNSWLSQEILRQAVNIISVYTQRIQTLEHRSARDRVIAMLIYLAERFGINRGKGILINIPITHQDIANSTNMNRETTSRTLELLFDEGLMSQTDHLLTVRSLANLQAALR